MFQSVSMRENRVRLTKSWKSHLLSEFDKSYMQDLRNFLLSQMRLKKRIFPDSLEYFTALNLVPFKDVKVVIIGQDPYHGPNQAHGLCFSVRPGVKNPPSLKNIFRELQSDLKIEKSKHGCLTSWAKQGVLLLNAILTVESGKPGSHQNKGWEIFTDRVIDILNKKSKFLVFILWGQYAQRKGQFIDETKHLVLKASHPSPFSADHGFFGCSHFSKTNQYLELHGKSMIDWNLPQISQE